MASVSFVAPACVTAQLGNTVSNPSCAAVCGSVKRAEKAALLRRDGKFEFQGSRHSSWFGGAIIFDSLKPTRQHLSAFVECSGLPESEDAFKAMTAFEGQPVSVGRRNMFLALLASVAGMAVETKPADAHVLNFPPDYLNNRYFLMRHAESIADVQGINLSNPADKLALKYGLSIRGAQQARAAAQALRDYGLRVPGWLWSSNFAAAYQTTTILREQLNFLWSDMRVDDLLDPRMLGAYDKKEATLRQMVWTNDQVDPHSKPPPADPLIPGSAESVYDIYRRCTELIKKLEVMYDGLDIVIVSHDDTLSVMQAALLEGDRALPNHRKYALQPGEFRLISIPRPDYQA